MPAATTARRRRLERGGAAAALGGEEQEASLLPPRRRRHSVPHVGRCWPPPCPVVGLPPPPGSPVAAGPDLPPPTQIRRSPNRGGAPHGGAAAPCRRRRRRDPLWRVVVEVVTVPGRHRGDPPSGPRSCRGAVFAVPPFVSVVDVGDVDGSCRRDQATHVEATENKSKQSRDVTYVVSATVVSVVVLTLLCVSCIWITGRKKATMTKAATTTRRTADGSDKKKLLNTRICMVGEDAGIPLLDFGTISLATDNFSPSNKVGEGGFGTVYKGFLDDGQEVAVKRLSWTSVQGTDEFINEATLISKLQHKNLVRLVGFCIHGEERMLIYEYMQNSSLDSFIFNENKRALLDWSKRSDIILGVAKGLMYLHHDSRYKIIHRDLKASNILLDGAMTPKISDFGTARIFGADQNMERTKRVIGTYGYMSPEYVINGTISVKSDVFSFGILTLEVLSGVRNRGTYMNESHWNLLTYAWKLWQEDNYLEFLDATVTSSFDTITQIARCIQLALLCVQERAADRPTMSTVVMMLSNENFPLPQPKRPSFLIHAGGSVIEHASSPSEQEYCTKNELTITLVGGR